jgi:hypothetical protein
MQATLVRAGALMVGADMSKPPTAALHRPLIAYTSVPAGAQAALLRALAAVLGELETVPDAALAAAIAAAGRLAGDYPILHPSGQRPDANAALAALLHALAPRPALLAAAAPRLAAAVLELTLRTPEPLAAPAAGAPACRLPARGTAATADAPVSSGCCRGHAVHDWRRAHSWGWHHCQGSCSRPRTSCVCAASPVSGSAGGPVDTRRQIFVK